MTSSRSAGIDALRIVGILAVVCGHVYGVPLTHQWVYPWHVPLFFILTGYLWSPGRTIWREVSTRTTSLMLPYVGWFVAVSATVLLISSPNAMPDLTSLLTPLWGGTQARGQYGTFWFISVLFFTAVLYRAIDRLPRAGQWAIAGAGLTGAYFVGPQLASMPLGMGLALPCLIFVLAGRGIRDLEPRVSRPVTVGLVLLGLSAAVIAFVPLAAVDVKYGQFGTPLAGVTVSVAIATGLLLIARQVPFGPLASKSTATLAAVGIAVVLSHPLVIWAATSRGLQPKWTMVAAIVLPWAFALLVSRPGFSSVLLGTSRRKVSASANVQPHDSPVEPANVS